MVRIPRNSMKKLDEIAIKVTFELYLGSRRRFVSCFFICSMKKVLRSTVPIALVPRSVKAARFPSSFEQLCFRFLEVLLLSFEQIWWFLYFQRRMAPVCRRKRDHVHAHVSTPFGIFSPQRKEKKIDYSSNTEHHHHHRQRTRPPRHHDHLLIRVNFTFVSQFLKQLIQN